VALPVGSELFKKVLGQDFGAGMVGVGRQGPALLAEAVLPAGLPEVGVVGCQKI